MPLQPGTKAKWKKQRAEFASVMHYKAMSDDHLKKPSGLYWVVNLVTNQRSDRPVTLVEFLSFAKGRRSLYDLVPAE